MEYVVVCAPLCDIACETLTQKSREYYAVQNMTRCSEVYLLDCLKRLTSQKCAIMLNITLNSASVFIADLNCVKMYQFGTTRGASEPLKVFPYGTPISQESLQQSSKWGCGRSSECILALLAPVQRQCAPLGFWSSPLEPWGRKTEPN